MYLVKWPLKLPMEGGTVTTSWCSLPISVLSVRVSKGKFLVSANKLLKTDLMQ